MSKETVTVTLTVSDWNIVLQAVSEVPLPFKVAAPLVMRLQAQLHRSNRSKPEVVTADGGVSEPKAEVAG